jgi:polysaccharide export outer membrane protein
VTTTSTTSTRTRSRSSWRTATSRALLAAIALAASSAAGADAVEYRIGPGDVVDVQVWREPDLSGSHRVDESGRIRHVLAGEFEAAGLSCSELADALAARLERDYLREARVVVTLTSSAGRAAAILGAVERPGNYPVTERTRLLDLVFEAGGLAGDATGSAQLFRAGAPIDVDLNALLAGEMAGNERVAAGDVIVVAGSGATAGGGGSARVRVVGEVARPGSYELSQAPTALDAVLAAGGFTDYAAGNRARLVREAEGERLEEKLRLDDIVRGREGALNVALQDGDLIVVPESLF